MFLAELKTTDGKVVGGLLAQPHTFKTGSRGYLAIGKLELDGKRYQCSLQLVEIHSKPNGKAENASEAPTPTG